MPAPRRELSVFLNRWPRRLAVVTCLLLAASSALSARAASPHPAEVLVPVVAAARPIAAGALVTAADLRVIGWPRRLVPAGTVSDPARLIGRRCAGAIGSGEAITATRLVGTDLAAQLPAGLLAVPVALRDPDSAALIRPGDHVDLLVTPGAAEPVPDAAPQPSAAATQIAADALVLAVLPADPAAGGNAELIIAADRPTTLRIAASAALPILAVRHEHP